MTNRFEARPRVTAAFLILGALVLAELLLRVAGPEALSFVHQARQVHSYSERWYVDLAPGKVAHLRLHGSDGSLLFNFLLTTNAHGIRTYDRERDYGFPPNARFIHAIGDSYTMGWGVDYTSSYPAILDWMLPPPYRVLNLGVDGYGTIAATGKSRELSARFKPAHVIYFFTPNDFDDDRRAVQVSQRSRLVHVAWWGLDLLRRTTYLANVPFAFRWRAVSRTVAPSAAGKVIHQAEADPSIVVLPFVEGPPPDPSSEPSLVQISRFAEALAREGARLTVLALSTDPRSLAFARHCRAQGIETYLVDFPPRMQLTQDGHLNYSGNHALAALVRRLVLERDAPP